MRSFLNELIQQVEVLSMTEILTQILVAAALGFVIYLSYEESKERGKEKEQRFRALTAVSLYRFLYRFIAPRGIWAPFGHHLPKKHH